MSKIPGLKPQRSAGTRDDIICWWPWGSWYVVWVIDDLKEHCLARPSPLWRGDVWATFSTLSSNKMTFTGRLLVKQQCQTPVGSQGHNNGRKACWNQSDMMCVCVLPKLACSVLHSLSLKLSEACTHTPGEKQNPKLVTQVSPGSPQWPLLSQGVLLSWPYHFSYFSSWFSCPIHYIAAMIFPSGVLTQLVAAGEKKKKS